MTEDQIKHMVDRFLCWKLPTPWHPDGGISYTRPNYPPTVDATPNGTNLFDATQAKAMVRHMLDGLPTSESFQARVALWMQACFGPEISLDKVERCDRFIEEALELVQAGGYTAERAHQLVDYVFGRPQGEINQEVGGVMTTLAAHCLAHGVDMHASGETELKRIWTKVDQIRAKQAAKPKHSPLPQ